MDKRKQASGDFYFCEITNFFNSLSLLAKKSHDLTMPQLTIHICAVLYSELQVLSIVKLSQPSITRTL